MAQRKNLNKFYRKYKYSQDARKFTLPGWVIKMGAGIARPFVKDQDARTALRFAKRFRRMRLLVMENTNSVHPADLKQMLNGIRQGKRNYDDFIQVRDGNTRVTFMIREKNDYIKDMLIVVSEEDTFVMLDMKAKFKIEHINELLQEFSEDMDVDIPVKPMPTTKKKERPKV